MRTPASLYIFRRSLKMSIDSPMRHLRSSFASACCSGVCPRPPPPPAGGAGGGVVAPAAAAARPPPASAGACPSRLGAQGTPFHEAVRVAGSGPLRPPPPPPARPPPPPARPPPPPPARPGSVLGVKGDRARA